MPKKKKGIEIAIAIFLIILTISMPVTFSALQPEVDLVKGEIKQNSFIDSLASFLSKVVGFFDIVPSVVAQEAQDMGCCEVMKNGAKCQISLESECLSQWHKGQTCETICQIGCCIDSQGFCNKESVPSQCPVPPALEFVPNDAQCQQDILCKMGCCSVGYQKIWTTNLTCNKVYHGIWDPSVSDELMCLQQTYQEQRGCCKSYAGCEYITGAECNAKGGSFLPNTKCYKDVPGCDCTLLTNGGKCVEGFPDLYKADSCGNVYIDEVAQSCGDGFCNPETNQCESGECSNIYKNYVSGEFGPKQSTDSAQNGESWCVYDTPLDLGNGTAPMGSRHWRHYCLYGKEYLEPCADYRQQVCGELQCIPKEGSTTSAEVCSSKTKDDCEASGCMWLPIKQAYCMPNRWRECFNITDEEDCNKHGSCFWWTDFQNQINTLNSLGLMPKYDLKIEEAEKDWLSFSKNKRKYDSHELPLCLPKYPPGLDDNNKILCTLGNYFCQYKEEWWGLDTENKECEKDQFYALIAHTCKSIGDCGIYVNYLGKNTTGFKILEVEKPQEGQDPAQRVKKEISTPKSYEDFVNAMKQIKGHPKRWAIPVLDLIGALFIAAIKTLKEGSSLKIFKVFTYRSFWNNVVKVFLPTSVPQALVAAGIILILLSLLMPIGPARGAMQAAGTGLITAGTLALVTSLTPWWITGIGIGVAVVVFLLYLLAYEEKFYMVQCNPSLPPVGGDDCHLCEEKSDKIVGGFARTCSKYRCESLGQACMYNDTIMIGEKTFKIADAQCIAAQNDGAAPWITSIEVKDLQGNTYSANPSSTTGPTTIDISKADGTAIPDGTSVIIKIKLNEKALCMWDIKSTSSMSEMSFPYQSTVLRDELQQQFLVKQALPFIYVRCADVYGNANVAEYIFRFSTTIGPDLTPPIVLGTDRDYNKKFGYGVTELPLWIYVNEQATCRWSKQDVDYSLMDHECSTILTSTGFKCSTTLTGLQSEPPGIANYFYIRCKDTSGNVMQQSYQLVLYPTLPLKITSIVPENGAKVKGCEVAGIKLRVETAEGAENGKATCYWKNNQTMTEFTRFEITNDIVHLTNLSATSQTVDVKCVDSALNEAQNSTRFTVEQDKTAPKITRIYKQGSQLVIRTDEKATCAYSMTQSCNFDATHWMNAIRFSTTDNLEHTTEWRSQPWYVKCYDSCGNGANLQDPCTIIFPSDLE